MVSHIVFGVNVKTVIWFCIALVLGLIFSMTMWPKWWRRFYEKKRLKRIANLKKKPEPKKQSKWLFFIFIVLLIAVFLVGTEIGFERAVRNMPSPPACPEYNCSPIDCEDLNIYNCVVCRCFLCDGYVKIEVPFI